MASAKITVLVSGSGTNLQRLMDVFSQGIIPNAEINLVVADRPCLGLERAKKAGIPTVMLTRGESLSRQLLEVVPQETSLIVLAGFLSILSEEFISRFENKIINIHPSLLPKYGGKGMWGIKVHEAVIENKEKYTGASVHYVTEGIDTGEVIVQKSLKIMPGESAEQLAKRVLELEYELLPEAVAKVLNSMC